MRVSMPRGSESETPNRRWCRSQHRANRGHHWHCETLERENLWRPHPPDIGWSAPRTWEIGTPL